jgi:hypothetical protein
MKLPSQDDGGGSSRADCDYAGIVAIGKVKGALLIFVAAAAVALATGSIVALRAYHEATRIDRSVPKAVVVAYVEAQFVQNDEPRAALYECQHPEGLASILSLRDALRDERARTGEPVSVVVGGMKEDNNGAVVTASIEINRGSGMKVRTDTHDWRFELVDEDGWRVCGAEQLPDSNPTPSATPPTAG